MRIDLYNKDCMQLLHELPNNSAEMVLTDIPYGEVNQKSSGLRLLDRGNADTCEIPLKEMVDELVRVCSGSIYIFCGTMQISEIISHLKGHKLTTRLCVWEKSNPSPMNGDKLWLSGAEFCVFARKPKATFNQHCQKAVWKYPAGRSKLHPTQKPLNLMKYLIETSSNAGDTVLDICMGSGTTGVACRSLGRNFVGCEINPEYFKIAETLIQEKSSDK